MTKQIWICNYCKKEIVSNEDRLSGDIVFRNYNPSYPEVLQERNLDFCDRVCLDRYMAEVLPTLEWESDI